jgi:hypothetical protein
MLIILCLYAVALWAIFSRFKLVRWGWASGSVALSVGLLILATFLALLKRDHAGSAVFPERFPDLQARRARVRQYSGADLPRASDRDTQRYRAGTDRGVRYACQDQRDRRRDHVPGGKSPFLTV